MSAVPKPAPRLAKSPTPIARTAVKRVNAKRQKRDFVKHFHSVERVAWVRSLPCVVNAQCGSVPRENHHVISRKAGGDYKQIVPLCEWHHYVLHSIGRGTFQRDFNIDLTAAAAETEKQWILYLTGHPGE